MGQAVISRVVEGSIAEELGVAAGDLLLTINGQEPRDIIDYEYAVTEEHLELAFRRADGTLYEATVTKDLDSDLGIIFDDTVFDGIRRCRNRCVFCFVDQMPPGMRKSLYVKDDDYRYSFLFGSYVTMGNLDEDDWKRILELRLSPLYVSVHATNPQTYKALVRPRQEVDVMGCLRRLAAHGIEVHTQVVVCPGINDGSILEQTIADLGSLTPFVRSIGIVPVGLTGHRRGLANIQPVGHDLAGQLVATGFRWQEHFRAATEEGLGLVYVADEVFIRAGLPFPDEAYYDGYPQLENGIGLCRLYLDEWLREAKRLPVKVKAPAKYVMICGESALPVISRVAEDLNKVRGLTVQAKAVKNTFFGGHVTVSGLLTGKDIIAQAGGEERGTVLLLPRVVLRESGDCLLDGVTPDDIASATGCEVRVVGPSARDLVTVIFGRRPRALHFSRGLVR